MKKLGVVITVLFASIVMYGQGRELNVGINGGITTGDIKPFSSSAFGLDANYLFDWYEDFKVGPSVSAVYFSPKENDLVKSDAFVYLPIGVAIRFQNPEDSFYIGGDFGYAIGISPSGDRGGVYFKPLVGYHISQNFKLNLFYSAVKKKQPAYSYVGLGLSFNIFGAGNDYYAY